MWSRRWGLKIDIRLNAENMENSMKHYYDTGIQIELHKIRPNGQYGFRAIVVRGLKRAAFFKLNSY